MAIRKLHGALIVSMWVACFAGPWHDRYNAFYGKLIEELATQYGPLAMMWFDGIEPVGPEKWKDTPDRVAAFPHPTRHHAQQSQRSPHVYVPG